MKYLFCVIVTCVGFFFYAETAFAQEAASEPTISQLAIAVTTEPRLTLAAALALALVVYGMKQVPFVKTWLAVSPMRTRAAAALLALAPGLITILAAHVSWDKALGAAILTFLTSTGVDKLMSAWKGSAQ